MARVDIVNPIPVMLDDLAITFVPDTAKHVTRDYKRDIDRWVRPFPVAIRPNRSAVWSTKSSIVIKSEPEPEEAKYINVGGTVMPMTAFKKVLDCFCGDMTCIDCSDTIKQYSKGVLYDA